MKKTVKHNFIHLIWLKHAMLSKQTHFCSRCYLHFQRTLAFEIFYIEEKNNSIFFQAPEIIKTTINQFCMV